MDKIDKKKLDKKKLAAAMVAVTAYIKTGEAAGSSSSASCSASTGSNGVVAMSACGMNLWGQTGRQALMQSSTMMQMRLFK